jgi:hypothetical protein
MAEFPEEIYVLLPVEPLKSGHTLATNPPPKTQGGLKAAFIYAFLRI